ncbi:MAG: beta-lactamase family protein [Ilumatobacteraceae bacterium]|nr:beta-lactamase family protein [Ilumatobacteraceae bacterium]
MDTLENEVDRIAQETDFAGVVRVDRGDDLELAKAYGMAHRGLQVANTIDTQFGIASGVKGMTALAIVSLIVDGALELSTPARTVLGHDLPLIDDAVTVEHLLSHRSGIGDYLDEDAHPDISDYVMPVPVHQLADTEQYLVALDGHPTKFKPGEDFSYCNGGFIVLALIAERVSGVPFHEFVQQRVCQPAGLSDSAFLRSDELPGRAALGYLEVDGVMRSNILHLPVRGNGDGGIYTTVADVRRLWMAFFDGRIVPEAWVAEMVQPRSIVSEDERYGLGFWLAGSGDAVRLEGYDAGVSFRTWHHPRSRLTHTVISNTSEGVWPVTRALYARLSTDQPG